MNGLEDCLEAIDFSSLFKRELRRQTEPMTKDAGPDRGKDSFIQELHD